MDKKKDRFFSKFKILHSYIVNRALFGIAILGLPALIATFFRSFETGWHPIQYFYSMLYLMILGTLVLIKKLSLFMRTTVLLTILILSGTSSLLSFGLAANGILFLSSFSIFVSILLGTRKGLIATGLSLCIIGVVGTFVSTGIIDFNLDANNYVTKAISWEITFVSFAFLIGITAFSAGNIQYFLVEAINRINKEKKHLEEKVKYRTFELSKSNDELLIEIIKREKAETRILKQKQIAERYLNIAGVMFIGLDFKGSINVANQKACDILECTETDIINENWFDNFVPQNIRNDVLSVFKQLMAGKVEPVEYYENSVISKNGKEKLIAWHNTIIKDDNDKIIGILGSGEDITDKKELEKKLIQAQKMEAIGNLAGGIAHEFNNILSIIIGNNELVMEELPEWSFARENTEEIQIAGLRARDVVKQLLTFGRQDNTAKKVINIRSVVHESIKLIRSSTPANIEIRQTLADDVCPVLGNDTQVNQVIINLCNNAIDAMPDIGGIMTIDLFNEMVDERHYPLLKSGRYAKLVVSDNGIGINKEILDRVFEPYFTTKEFGKGTGIGLAIVHGIVERHGGSIIADSHPGQGTIFTLFFPAYEGLLEQETDEPNNLPTGEECILYVDDEPSIAKLGKRHLERLGYTTESTTDPLKALEMVQTDPEKFDLVISDMAMPNMTGDQLIIEILKLRPNMPTIICTGYSAKISEKEAAKIGICVFAMKPLDKSDLAKTVRKVLDEAKDSAQGSISYP